MAFHFSLLFLLLILSLFSSPVFPLSSHHHPSDPPRGVLFEEKTRLGSTPPSCFNKCNQCHPCTAVQMPTLPSFHQVQNPPPSRLTAGNSVAVLGYHKSSWDNDRYSNYKPLGWKCRCKDHFYNP